MTAPPQTFRLPRLDVTFSVFPANELNSHYAECRPHSQAWIDKYFKIVCGPTMAAFLTKCNPELLTAYVYPYARPDGLRTTMDFVRSSCYSMGQGLRLSPIQMNVTLIYDEFTDTLSGEEASKAANIIHRTLNDRDYDDGSWICQLMKEYVYLEVLLFTH